MLPPAFPHNVWHTPRPVFSSVSVVERPELIRVSAVDRLRGIMTPTDILMEATLFSAFATCLVLSMQSSINISAGTF